MPWNQAATSIGSGDSYVMPDHRTELQEARLRPGGLRSPQHHRAVLRLPGSEVPQRCAQRASLHCERLGNQRNLPVPQRRPAHHLVQLSQQLRLPTRTAIAPCTAGAAPTAASACAGVTTPCRGWLNPAAFSVNPAGTFGNVVKGSFVGPHYVDWDGSISRKFAFTERTSLIFQADYFNVLNHTNLGDPGTTLGSTVRQDHEHQPTELDHRSGINIRSPEQPSNCPVVTEAAVLARLGECGQTRHSPTHSVPWYSEIKEMLVAAFHWPSGRCSGRGRPFLSPNAS